MLTAEWIGEFVGIQSVAESAREPTEGLAGTRFSSPIWEDNSSAVVGVTHGPGKNCPVLL